MVCKIKLKYKNIINEIEVFTSTSSAETRTLMVSAALPSPSLSTVISIVITLPGILVNSIIYNDISIVYTLSTIILNLSLSLVLLSSSLFSLFHNDSLIFLTITSSLSSLPITVLS